MTVALVLMALATLGSSWSGFQSSLWNGIQTFPLADGSKMGRLGAQYTTMANHLRNLDTALFMEYARAISERNEVLAEFIRARMRPEVQPALSAWLNTRPMKNRNAPSSPFVMPEYKLKADSDADEENAHSAAKHDEAQAANMNSDSYSMLTVFFTAGLFLAGLITGFDEPSKRWLAAALSLVMILFATVILLRLPIAHRG